MKKFTQQCQNLSSLAINKRRNLIVMIFMGISLLLVSAAIDFSVVLSQASNPDTVDPPPTFTPVPPTATLTNTPVPPTATLTNTPVPPTATLTNTPVPPTATFTNTPVPPTATFTNTPVPPTATLTNTPTPLPAKLTVTKRIAIQGDSSSNGQVFIICIQGPSYLTGTEPGACKPFSSDRESKVWENLIAGTYVVIEQNPGSEWLVNVTDSPITLEPGNAGSVTVTNTLLRGILNVVTTVDWQDVDPLTDTTFQICISGPSFPQSNCKSTDYNGSTVVWSDLASGVYQVSQSSSADWTVGISGSPATVVANSTASAFVNYTLKPSAINLTMSAAPQKASANEPVLLSYQVANIGETLLTNVAVSDARCANIGYVSGDANNNQRLEASEIWLFQCQTQTSTDVDHSAFATAKPPLGSNIQSNRATVFIDVLPAIRFTKSVSPDLLEEPGGIFTYQLTIQNSASEAVRIQSLRDELPFGLACESLVAVVLEVGQSIQCAYNVEHRLPGTITSTAAVTVTDNEGNEVNASATASASVNDLPSAMSVTYSNPGAVPEEGDTLRFTVIVQNDSRADSIAIRQIDDSIFGDISQPSGAIQSTNCAVPQTLAPASSTSDDDSYACTFDAFVQADMGTIFTHELTVQGEDDDGQSVMAQDQSTVLVYDVDSVVKLTVSAQPETVSEPGGDVDFQIQIVNRSPVDSVVLKQLVDNQLGNLTQTSQTISQSNCALPQTLDPDEIYECAYRGRVSGRPGTSSDHVVVVAGQKGDRVTSAFDQVSLSIVDVPAELAIQVDVDPATLPESGRSVNFTVVVTNQSLVDAVTINTLSDDLLGNLAPYCGELNLPQTISPDAQLACSFSAWVAGDAGQPLVSSLRVNGIDDDNQPVGAETTVSFELTDVPSKMSMTVVPDKETVSLSGEPVTYLIEVHNESAADTLTLTGLNDSLSAAGNGQGRGELIDSDCAFPQTLQPDQRYQCTIVRLIGGPLGQVYASQLTIEAQDDDNVQLTASAEAVVTVAEPILEFVQTVALVEDNDNVASPGDRLRYTITIQNQGNSAAREAFVSEVLDTHTSLLVGTVETTQGSIEKGNAATEDAVRIAVGTIEIGDIVTIRFDVMIDENLPESVDAIANQALITGGNFPTISSRGPKGEGPTITQIRLVPVLVARKSVSLSTDLNQDGEVNPGDSMIYEIVLVNSGLAAVANVVLDDRLNPNLALVPGTVSTTQGTVLSGNQSANSLVQIAVGQLEVGERATIRFETTINPALPASVTSIDNQAVVTADAITAVLSDDPATVAVNDPTVVVLQGQSLLEATKLDLLLVDSNSDGLFSSNDTMVYQITVQNRGSASALNVQILDNLDPNTRLLPGSVQTDDGQVVMGNGAADESVEITIAQLAAGETVRISFQARINGDLAGRTNALSNQAIIRRSGYPDVLSDDPTVAGLGNATLTPVNSGPILLLTNEDILFIDADENGIVSTGDTLLYRLTLENVGTSAADEVLITDTPDRNTQLVPGSIRAEKGTILMGNDAGETQVQIDIGTLQSSEKVTVSFLVRLNEAIMTRSLANQASVQYIDLLVQVGGQATVVSDDPTTSNVSDPTITLLEGFDYLFLPVFRR